MGLAQPEQLRAPRLLIPVSARDHIAGRLDAPLTLVEYGDYECPYCARAYVTVKHVQHQLAGRLRFVFRNFPLNTVHPNAEAAAEVAEAAANQGTFWEMHDMLFRRQDALEPTDLLGYAESLGLDAHRILSELRARLHEARIREDFVSGAQSGVNGTPTFFVNDMRHDDSWDAQTLIAALLRRRRAG